MYWPLPNYLDNLDHYLAINNNIDNYWIRVSEAKRKPSKTRCFSTVTQQCFKTWLVESFGQFAYCKVSSKSTSRLVAHPRNFRLFMKGKFDAYLLWPLAKRVQNWIVARSTAHNFTVDILIINKLHFHVIDAKYLGYSRLSNRRRLLNKSSLHFLIFFFINIFKKIWFINKRRPTTIR